MSITLTPLQCRVIGVMLEKEITTPEQYPLSLNGLTNACNQKSNREPVLSLSESEVQQIVDELMAKNLVSDQGAFSGRVAKYSHRFCNTEFGDLKFSAQERAIICVLLLRGAQTPGELRTRTNRLAEFANVTEVEQALDKLQNGESNPLVAKLEREPGKRESRYVQLFVPLDEQELVLAQAQPGQSSVAINDSALEQRVAELEQQVAKLQQQISQLL